MPPAIGAPVLKMPGPPGGLFQAFMSWNRQVNSASLVKATGNVKS